MHNYGTVVSTHTHTHTHTNLYVTVSSSLDLRINMILFVLLVYSTATVFMMCIYSHIRFYSIVNKWEYVHTLRQTIDRYYIYMS